MQNLTYLKRRFPIFLALMLMLSIAAIPASAQSEGYSPVDDLRTWSLGEYEAAGNAIESFNEAPALAELVAAGELPPVEERLPDHEEVVVVQPRESIGQYGGVIRYNATNPNSLGNTGFSAMEQRLLAVSTNWEEIFPNIASSVELSEDQRVATITLRHGIKWSDGVPVTTSDVMFWYEDIAMNSELPALPSDLRPGGNDVVIEAIDDYTFTMTFVDPYPAILTVLGVSGGGFPLAPRHYLEQWHISYNEEANELAAEEGYDSWVGAFTYHYNGQLGDDSLDPNMPVLRPWVLERVDEFGNRFYTRNPYYWKVDTEGNQLPYLDGQVRMLLSDPEVVLLNVQSGELDYGFYNLEVSDLPVLRAGEATGDYTTILWPADQGSMNKYQFNLTVGDPVLQELFRDIRFRQAMSLAINREEINETLYFGLAVPRQWGVASSSVFYEDWMGDYYAAYDPDQANALLDELGLTMGPDGVRLRPDGEPLRIVLWDAINRIPMSELIAEYWKDVGVGVEINPSTREAFQAALIANEVHASVWFADLVAEVNMYLNPVWLRPPYGIDTTPVGGGLVWRQWYLSGGTEGEEPPEYFREQMELVAAWQLSERGTDEYYELGQEAVNRTVEQLFHIGTVGEAPEVFIRANRLHNFPPEEGTVYINHLLSGHADQWYVTGD